MNPDEFAASWRRFVATWAAQPRRDRRAGGLVDDVLARGLAAWDSENGAVEPTDPPGGPDADVLLECELVVLRRSGLFDAAAYEVANERQLRDGTDPLVHFAGPGWTELRNPCLDFDVWWYWSEHLDPSRYDINPLLHYALAGRLAGLSALPPNRETRPPATFEPGTQPRRICLFAAYDVDGVIDPCVVDYVRELDKHADVYFLSDGYVEPEELAKLSTVTQGAWAIHHGAYDFGSYSLLARELVGWDVIDGYDELLLVNDSAYLLRPLDDVFAEMDAHACDWWGLQVTKHDYVMDSNGGRRPLPHSEVSAMTSERVMKELDHMHVSSYFLGFRGPVLRHEGFRRRLDGVVPQAQKQLVVYKYEIGLSRYLMSEGFGFSTFVRDLYPFHPLYTEQYFDLLAHGFPLLKRNFVTENSKNVPDLVHWKTRVLAHVPDAPVDAIERNLLRVAAHDRLQRSLSIVRDEAGHYTVPRPLSRWEMAEEDRFSPSFDHWWAFPVGGPEEVLSGDQRALLEEVRTDPTVRKVVLTRGREVRLEGENLTIVPMLSAEGQRLLARCGHVFLAHDPAATLPDGVSPRRHRLVHLGGTPLGTWPAEDEADPEEEPDEDVLRYTHLVASSEVDALAMAAQVPLARPRPPWVTGAPRNDLLLRAAEELPEDVREQEARLREALEGRRLVLLLLSRGGPAGALPLADDQLKRVAAWAQRNDVVLGYREDAGDPGRTLSRVLRPLGAVDLGVRRYPSYEVLERVADAMVTDSVRRAAGFTVTRKPALCFLPGPGSADRPANRSLLDPSTVLPAGVCRDVAGLLAALETLLEPFPADLQGRYAERVRLLHAYQDDRNARRLALQVKEEYPGRSFDSERKIGRRIG